MENINTIFVDIDDTICCYKDDNGKIIDREGPTDYSKAVPYLDRIEKINNLHDQGKIIVYWTARGTATGIKWFHVTLKQLQDWGCKFHELKMGKPNYDIFIDDKNINSEVFFSDVNKIALQ